ncbi:hypothetical protein EHP00_786 [Ecytonucleospora hepatopenaei]|uniref:Uncharacterized protein n=1 Tax=Ecytonucleospora hepatopenaei TaxID=646526 RepID=A0A1W0E7T5_9MICR|nr:hypothetical protein EHP00_786 [Ecytonucleospora hepatopenaei]
MGIPHRPMIFNLDQLHRFQTYKHPTTKKPKKKKKIQTISTFSSGRPRYPSIYHSKKTKNTSLNSETTNSLKNINAFKNKTSLNFKKDNTNNYNHSLCVGLISFSILGIILFILYKKYKNKK